MKNHLLCVIIIILMSASSAFGSHKPFRPQCILIKTKSPLSIDSVRQFRIKSTSTPKGLSRLNIKAVKPIGPAFYPVQAFGRTSELPPLSNVYLIRLNEPVDILQLVQSLKEDPDIIWAQPNYIYKTAGFVPNDTHYAAVQTSYLDVVNAENGWALSQGNATIVIAVIDTGVDWDHVDLKNVIWQNPNEIENGIDDDGNGYVDDIRGYDFVDNIPPPTINGNPMNPEEDYAVEDNDPMDCQGHGTHVSGIASAQTHNQTGIAGIGFGCRIMAVRAGYKDAGGDGQFDGNAIIAAIRYAADNGAHIINMSFGGNPSTPDHALEEAVQYATEKKLILVVAAGNHKASLDGGSYIPASYDQVLAISALDHDGVFDESYSNYGESIFISAPGTDIFSTSFNGAVNNDTYATDTGTSFASPIVAGAVALILSLNPNADVKTILQLSARDAGPIGRDSQYGYGILDLERALIMADPYPPTLNHHDPVTTTNPSAEIPIWAEITDQNSENAAPSASVFFQYTVNLEPVSEWTEIIMSVSQNNTYTATIPTPSSEITDIEYYFQLSDFNPSNTVTYPENAPTESISIFLQDSMAPIVNSKYQNNDYFSHQTPPTFNIWDNTQVSANTVSLSIQTHTTLYTFDHTDSRLSYSNSVLNVSLDGIDLEPGTVTFTLSVADIYQNQQVQSFHLLYTESLHLTGSSQGDDSPLLHPILNVPNPFDPDHESTYISYQISMDAYTDIVIYNLVRQKIKQFEIPLDIAGYHEIEWDGSDATGNKVPNGVYLMFIRATAQGQTVTQHHKIAILRK